MNENTDLKMIARNLIRQQVAYEKDVNKQIERSIEVYRARMPEIFAESIEGRRPICVLAEGDSWFKYMIGLAIIFFVDRERGVEALNLASPGDEVKDMMTPRQFRRLKRELKRGPTLGENYDFFLFSGGGNDLLGQGRFRTWLNQYEPGMTPEEIINQNSLKSIIEYLKARYQEVIDARNEMSPLTTMLVHGYDFAHPTGVGVCRTGPWLKPGLEERNVPEELQFDVVREFLRIFEQMLKSLVESNENMQLVQTQGTLDSIDDWDNEIHPTRAGFKKLAKKFIRHIKSEI